MARSHVRLHHQRLTLGQRMADGVSLIVGSWGFIAFVFAFFAFWVGMNIFAVALRWDPYPFILFNLFLSMLAALQAPVILMSQNRAAERDRWRTKMDYAVNIKAEREIKLLQAGQRSIKRMIQKHNTNLLSLRRALLEKK